MCVGLIGGVCFWRPTPRRDPFYSDPINHQPHTLTLPNQSQKKPLVLRSFADGLASANPGFAAPERDGYANLCSTYLQLVRLGAYDA